MFSVYLEIIVHFQDFADDKELLTNIFEAASVYFNFTGDAKCLNIQDEDDIGADMWSYQVHGINNGLPNKFFLTTLDNLYFVLFLDAIASL